MTDGNAGGLENKAAAPAAAFEDRFYEFMHGFEEFKRSNDERLAEIERRGSADVVTEDKVDRLNRALDGAKAALDRMSLERARPQLEGGRTVIDDEYKDAFSAYVKRGEEKALTVGTPGDGGYLVPGETETEILTRLAAISPIRALASVRQVSTSVYKKPVTLTGPAASWVAETASRTTATASQTKATASLPGRHSRRHSPDPDRRRFNAIRDLPRRRPDRRFRRFGRIVRLHRQPVEPGLWAGPCRTRRILMARTLADWLAGVRLLWRLNAPIRTRRRRSRPVQRRSDMNLAFLDGYKTYIVAAAMIIAGLSQLTGIDLPSFDGQSAGHLLMEGLAIIFLRKGIKVQS